MKFIGVTGGVGAGKSCVLNYLLANYNCKVVYADDVAKALYVKGTRCYRRLVRLLGRDILNEEGNIDTKKMAAKIYADESLRLKVNGIVHPEVKREIFKDVRRTGREGRTEFFFLEAALLIEAGYKKYLDELWYIYTDTEVRKMRLKASRGYSDEKTESIIASQLSDEQFRKNADFVIDNSGTEENTYRQIRERMSIRYGR